MILKQKWSLFKQYIRNTLDPEEYQGWLDDLQLVEIGSDHAVIAGISHPVFQHDIKKNYDALFRRILGELFPEHSPFTKKQIEYHVGEHQLPKKIAVQEEFAFSLPSFEAAQTPHSTLDSSAEEMKLSLSNTADNKVLRFPGNPTFDSNHRLDSFVVGPTNQVACKVGGAAAKNPGIIYNPLVIYGSMGVGKTHLMEAIGHEIQRLHPQRRIIYVSAETFLNDFISHLRTNRMHSFRKRYREVDVFMLDDLQMLGGAEKCQDELLYTVNALRQQEKQIIITTNVLPQDIKTLDQTLRSRLESGMIADIKVPDLETRMAILNVKARQKRIPLPTDVCEFMAKHIYSDVRKLDGALTRLGAYSSLLCEPISLEFAQTTLEDFLEVPPSSAAGFSTSSVPLEDQILHRACSCFQSTVEDAKSKRRDNYTLKARKVAMYLLKELTLLSLKQIGEHFNRSHSAVHSSLKQVRGQMATDEFFQKQILALQFELTQGQLPMPEVAVERKLSGGRR
ncbi:chromosomal replication initiator protein DnaA [Deltaproteobacteria bacterium TL4]